MEGGTTYFPLLDVEIQPQKGSAIFWFNLDSNGGPILESLHAGCPVNNGTKWGKVS